MAVDPELGVDLDALDDEPAPQPRAPPEPAEPAPRDDDDAAYSAAVRKRIAKVTQKRYEAETRAQVAEARATQEAAARIELEKRLATLELETARATARKAHADGDADAQVSANEQIATAAQRLVHAQSQVAPAAQPRVTGKTQEWIEAHSWYEADDDARDLANKASDHARTLYAPETKGYWEYIERTVKAERPDLFPAPRKPQAEEEPEDEPAPPPPRPAVAPVAAATRRAAPGAPAAGKLPRLTADELLAAELVGATPQEYAANKMTMGKT